MAKQSPPTQKKTPSKTQSQSQGKTRDKTDEQAKGESVALAASAPEPPSPEAMAKARDQLAATGRNDPCPCGSGKKYKKCHLLADQAAATVPPEAPTPKEMVATAWGLFEQRRPGAAEREFRAALALDPTLVDARVGIGMARLSANDADAARVELDAVVKEAEPAFAKMRADKVSDAFTRTEAQPLIRAAHALGCLAYDQERYADATADLERVYSIDVGTVGTEARLIAAKALMKLDKPQEAVAVLEPAAATESGQSRAQMGLALAHFAAGAKAEAAASLNAALQANPHFAKAVLGRIRRRVENLAGSQPGSVEEALVYAQTYGDVWTEDAKKMLSESLEAGTGRAPASEAAATTSAAPDAG